MLTFHKADESHASILRGLAEKIWRAYYPPIIGAAQVEYMLEMMYEEGTIRREIAEGIHWELASYDGEAAGFLSITAEENGRAKLNKLYLVPGLQGRGLGQQLIAHACDTAAVLGGRELWLQVNKRNDRAIRAYHRAGFHVEKEAVFDIGNGYVMDDFIMAREVP